MVKDELRDRSGFSDSEIDCGGLRITTTFTRQAMRAAEAGAVDGATAGPRRAARRGRLGRPADRRAARHVRRPGLPRQPAQLGRSRAGRRGRRSSRSRSARRSSTASRWTRSTATPRSRCPTARRSATRARAGATATGDDQPAHRHREVGEHRLRRPDRLDGQRGPQKVIDIAVDDGHPAARARARAEPGIALGSATVSPIDMANAYGTIANGGVAKDWSTSSRRSAAPTAAATATSTGSRPPRCITRTSPRTRRYALQQVVAARAPARNAHVPRPARSPARPARRPTTAATCRRRGSSGTPRSSPPR